MNPNITLGVNNLQLNNPLDAYAKMSQIQGAQNQNALAQYQLAAAQRDDVVNNALNQSYQKNFRNGFLDEDAVIADIAAAGGGSKIQGIRKGFEESRSAKTKVQKEELELVNTRLEQSRGILDRIDPNAPDAPQQVMGWFTASQSDPILRKALREPVEQMARQKGMTYEEYLPQFMKDRQFEVEQAIAQGTQGLSKYLQRAVQGNVAFAEKNKASFYQQSDGATGRIIEVQGGKATTIPGSEYTVQMTPGQRAADSLARQREARMSAGGSGGSVSVNDLIDPAVEAAAQRYRANGTLPSLSGKEGTLFKKRVLERAAQLDIDANVSAEDAVVNQAEGKSVEMSMKQMQKTRDNIDAYERQFQKNVVIAQKAFDLLDNTKMPLLNKWINAGKRNITGDPGIAKVDTAVKAVVDEFSKIVSGAMGNTVVAQGQIKRVEKLLNDAQSPEQVKAALDIMVQETHNRIKGFDETQAVQKDKLRPKGKASSGGSHPKDIEDLLKMYPGK